MKYEVGVGSFMDIVTIFCWIDDFCVRFEAAFRQKLVTDKIKRRNRSMKTSLIESAFLSA